MDLGLSSITSATKTERFQTIIRRTKHYVVLLFVSIPEGLEHFDTNT